MFLNINQSVYPLCENKNHMVSVVVDLTSTFSNCIEDLLAWS